MGGMALTGYTRSGQCVERSDDAGSHHICIDLSSTGDADGNNFCQVTGQSDWCSYEDMPCHNDGDGDGDDDDDDNNDDDDGTTCAISNWCVCQWAFSSYVLASGCDNIQTIVCESINLEAILAYKKILVQPTWYSNAGSVDTTKYQAALECIVSRCNLDINNLPTGNGSSSSSLFSSLFTNHQGRSDGWLSSVLIAFLIAGIAVSFFLYRRRRPRNTTINTDGGKDGLVTTTS